MHIVLMILLVILFGYSLILVITNHNEVAVNLLFTQVPQMNLGLLLIVTLTLGIAIGLLLALMVFRVFQLRFEIGRKNKHIARLEASLQETTTALEQARKNHALGDLPDSMLNTTPKLNTDNSGAAIKMQDM